MLATLMLIAAPLLFAFVLALLTNRYLVKRLPKTLGSRLLVVGSTIVAVGFGGFVGLIAGVQTNRLFDYKVLSEALGGAELFSFSEFGPPRMTPQGAAYLYYTLAGLLLLAIGFTVNALVPFFRSSVASEAEAKPVGAAEVGWVAVEKDFVGDDAGPSEVNPVETPRKPDNELI